MATLAQPRLREWAVSTSGAVVAVLIGWIVLWFPLHGINTLPLASSELTPLHTWLNGLNEAINASRSTSPLFLYVFNPIRLVIDTLVRVIQGLISQPAFGRPAAVLGWLGSSPWRASLLGLRQRQGRAPDHLRTAVHRAGACGRRPWTRWR
jgi:hypothetical protein